MWRGFCVCLAPPPHLLSRYPAWAAPGSTLAATRCANRSPKASPSLCSLPLPLPQPNPCWGAPSLPLTGPYPRGCSQDAPFLCGSWRCCRPYSKRSLSPGRDRCWGYNTWPVSAPGQVHPIAALDRSLNSRTAQSEGCGSPSARGFGAPTP